MAVKDAPSMGIRHVTVVPTNLRADDDEESDRESRREPRVPRHR